MPFPWGHNRRFNSYTEYFRRKFGQRIQKVTIDAGFTCPNRDGTLGTGGCSYCYNDSFNPSYCRPDKTVTLQIAEGIEFHARRYRRANKFLAYFQPYSNTYAPLEKLKKIYEEALHYPGVTGLVIGTRPDCIDDDILDYLYELSQNHYIIIEYGIESCYNNTLVSINRGHTFEQSAAAIRKTALKGIHTGAHLIFGLPGESREEMLAEAAMVSSLPLTTIKFHQLIIVKNTPMAEEYQRHPEKFNPFSLEEYLDFIVDFLERLNPSIVVERFAAEVPPRYIAGPHWGLIRYDQVAGAMEKRLEERDTWQGKVFNGFAQPHPLAPSP
ncbi:MAG: TIGR01212 family radical SAM protein [Bacteroidetes bacterium]|nr:TIGR01212 family radical SAM protein [Bacteroidota bacterium]